MKTPTTIIVLLALMCIASASQEGILALSGFRLESAGIGSSGKVVIEGKQNEKRETVSLKINAFDKEYVVPKNKLARLSGLHANGVRISYEGGYTVSGGRTIYIQFQMGFTSGTREQALVTLTEDGKVEVSRSEVKGAQPGDSPKDGPATSVANSDASEGGRHR